MRLGICGRHCEFRQLAHLEFALLFLSCEYFKDVMRDLLFFSWVGYLFYLQNVGFCNLFDSTWWQAACIHVRGCFLCEDNVSLSRSRRSRSRSRSRLCSPPHINGSFDSLFGAVVWNWLAVGQADFVIDPSCMPCPYIFLHLGTVAYHVPCDHAECA
jgi:hypothetical protein